MADADSRHVRFEAVTVQRVPKNLSVILLQTKTANWQFCV